MKYTSKEKRALFGILLCTVLISVSQILWKIGIDSEAPTFFHKLLNFNVILGGIFYFMAAGGLVASFRDGELSVLYPIVSFSFIWVSIMSLFFLDETLSMINWFGIILVVCGVSIINIKN